LRVQGLGFRVWGLEPGVARAREGSDRLRARRVRVAVVRPVSAFEEVDAVNARGGGGGGVVGVARGARACEGPEPAPGYQVMWGLRRHH